MSVFPTYTIHRYTDEIYKVVHFKRSGPSDFVRLPVPREEHSHYDTKLSNSVSRARSAVLQYALCNPWEFFFTGTLDRTKFDRYDLDRYQIRLSQFIRDQRKKWGSAIQYLLVPEMHADGAWHIHGLISGLPDSAITLFPHNAPRKLREGGFLNWPDYMDKFGFCSLGAVRDPLAVAFYTVGYLDKNISARAGAVGKHLYFHSRPLNKACKASDIYSYHSELSGLCVNEYEFCSTGMVLDQSWSFPYVWDGADYPIEDLTPLRDPMTGFDPAAVDPTYEQLTISDFARWCNG